MFQSIYKSYPCRKQLMEHILSIFIDSISGTLYALLINSLMWRVSNQKPHNQLKAAQQQKYTYLLSDIMNSNATQINDRKQFHYGKVLQQKPCYLCKKNEEGDIFALCDGCDDAYHIQTCLQEFNSEQHPWLCPLCVGPLAIYQAKKKMFDIIEQSKKVRCYICLNKFAHTNPNLTIQGQYHNYQNGVTHSVTSVINPYLSKPFRKCRYCCYYFDRECFSSRTNSVCCGKCQKLIRQQSPKSHILFIQYLKSEILKSSQNSYFKLSPRTITQLQTKKYHPQIGFILAQQHISWQTIVRFQQSLYYALKVNKLAYQQSILQLNNPNNQVLDPIPRLHQNDQQVFQQFLKQTKKYRFPHLQIKQDEILGFYVVATQKIAKNTIISEYVGQVESRRNYCEHIHNDSVMILLTTFYADTSLDIVPVKFGNISRFYLGLKAEQRYRQNIRTCSFSYQGRCRIIVHACRDIEADQKLLLDYNAGQLEEYPTQNFNTE